MNGLDTNITFTIKSAGTSEDTPILNPRKRWKTPSQRIRVLNRRQHFLAKKLDDPELSMDESKKVDQNAERKEATLIEILNCCVCQYTKH